MAQTTERDIKLLEHIYDGAQMGRDSISQLLKSTDNEQFRSALETQQEEYERLMKDAGEGLRTRGAQPQGISMMSKASAAMMTGAKTLMDNSVPNMAEMMIQGSTMGVTKLTRQLSETGELSPDVERLSERLIRTEESNIESMKGFL